MSASGKSSSFLAATVKRALMYFGGVNVLLMLWFGAGAPASLTVDGDHTAMEAVHVVAIILLVVLVGSLAFAAFSVISDRNDKRLQASSTVGADA